MEEIAVISAVRTPIGAYLGAMKDVPAYDLVATVLNGAVKAAGVKPEQVDEVVFGHCYQSGEYVNIARMGLLTAGWPVTVPGISVDRRCTSGLDALLIGGMEIQTGNSDIVVAGGVESMSSAEFYIPGNIKWGIGRGAGIQYADAPRGHGSLKMQGMVIYDRIQRSRPMHQPISRFGEIGSNMQWAEGVAKEINLTREECDKWAYRSHMRASKAWETGRFKDYVVPVTVKGEKGDTIVDKDEGPRPDTTLEKLAKLKPTLGGVCTPGNSSMENDAAAAYVLMSASKAKAMGLKPLGYVKAWAKAADDPWNPPKAGTKAFKAAVAKAGLTLDQIDLFEIQEAFAAQCLYNIKTVGIPEKDWDNKVNVNGSGIALGHPLGATLALRVCALLHEMEKRNLKYGITGTPTAGANAVACVFERK